MKVKLKYKVGQLIKNRKSLFTYKIIGFMYIKGQAINYLLQANMRLDYRIWKYGYEIKKDFVSVVPPNEVVIKK